MDYWMNQPYGRGNGWWTGENHYVRLVTDAADEAVTLAEAKLQSRLGEVTSPSSTDSEDGYITSLIPAARKAIERNIGRQIGAQELELGLTQWPWGNRIELPRPPLIELLSIKYTKTDGTVVTWYDSQASPVVDPAQFVIETGPEPGAIFLTALGMWPSAILTNGYPIKIRFTAGIVDVPADLKQAMLLLGAHMFETREPVDEGTRAQAIEIPMTIDWLCETHRYKEFI